MLEKTVETVNKVVEAVVETSKEAVTDVVWVFDREGLMVPKYIQKEAMASGEDNPRGWR